MIEWITESKNLGSRKPNETIRIPIDALESICNFCKISGAKTFGKYANWSRKIFSKFHFQNKIISRKPNEIIRIPIYVLDFYL